MFNKIHAYLVQNAASILRPPIHLLPKFMQNKILLEGLNTIFQEALIEGDLAFLEDKWLKIEIKDLDVSWMISYQHEQFVVAGQPVTEDACFRGHLNDLILIAGRKEDPDTLFFQRRLSIEGDTEFGLEVKNLIDSVDLDILPIVLKSFLSQLSDFVYKGVELEMSIQERTKHAHTNRSTGRYITH